MSLIHSLEIGKRALAVQQSAINTAGHNIANLSTPGYARQTVVSTNISLDGQVAGMDLAFVEQIRDRLLESHLQSETQDLGRWQATSHWMRQVENFFMTDGEIPLNTTLGRFWDSWQDLANDPTSDAARETVRQRAESLAFEITTIRQQLTDAGYQINQQMRDDISEINTNLENLASLNRSITIAEADGQTANALRDERYRIVSELSEKINVQAIESSDNEFILSMSGIELVHGEHASLLEVQETVQDGQPRIVASQGNETLPINSGELAGLAEVRDDVLPELLDQLDAMTSSLISQVNSIHQTGYNLEYQTGIDFFAGTDSSNIQVTLRAEQIATSASASSLSDNTVALNIAQLRISGQVGENGKTFEEYFADTVVQVGIITQKAIRFEQNQTYMVDALKEQQQSISGVSLDEEMTSLIQFQRAYEAAASYLSTVDELLQSLIGIVS